MTRRNSDSNIPPLAIRLFYLAAVAVTLPLLIWNGLVQQMNASAGDILFWTRGPVHSPSVARIVLLAIDDCKRQRKPSVPGMNSVVKWGSE